MPEHEHEDTPSQRPSKDTPRRVTVKATDKSTMVLEQQGSSLVGTCPKCGRVASYPAPILRGAHVECPRTGVACGWAGWAQ